MRIHLTWYYFQYWMQYVDEMRDEVGCAVNFDQWREIRIQSDK